MKNLNLESSPEKMAVRQIGQMTRKATFLACFFLLLWYIASFFYYEEEILLPNVIIFYIIFCKTFTNRLLTDNFYHQIEHIKGRN